MEIVYLSEDVCLDLKTSNDEGFTALLGKLFQRLINITLKIVPTSAKITSASHFVLFCLPYFILKIYFSQIRLYASSMDM